MSIRIAVPKQRYTHLFSRGVKAGLPELSAAGMRPSSVHGYIHSVFWKICPYPAMSAWARAGKILLALFVFAVLTAPVAAAVHKNDFAYGYSLEVDGDGAIYSLYLNEDIYQGLTRSDRADIRVFNSQGIAVPHYLRRKEQYTRQVQEMSNVEPPIFPLYKDGVASTTDKYNVHITTNDQGAIIDINYGKQDPQARELAGYLIDISALEHPPNRMLLFWAPDQGDFVTALQIEVSNDLTHWQTLVSRATLSDLQYGQHTLIQNQLELPLRKAKYLRLNWLGKKALLLEKVVLGFAQSYTVEPQPRQWSEVAPDHYDDKTHTFYFKSGAMLPVDRISIGLPQRNTLVRVDIESAETEQGPWYSRYHGLLYDLQQEGERLTNPEIQLPVNSHRYWRLHIVTEAGQLGGEPLLKLGWIPEQLLFVAQGESPFTLAYGSARVNATATPLSQLLHVQTQQQQDKLIKLARLGAKVELGDASRLEPAPPPRDWKHVVLWSVLVLGVVILALMALRLYKQMDNPTPKE